MATKHEQKSRMWEALTEEEFLQGRSLLSVRIDGVFFQRLPFGSPGEPMPPNVDHCPDCGAGRGEVHIPICDIERCPKCRGQFNSCACDIETDAEFERFEQSRERCFEYLHGDDDSAGTPSRSQRTN